VEILLFKDDAHLEGYGQEKLLVILNTLPPLLGRLTGSGRKLQNRYPVVFFEILID